MHTMTLPVPYYSLYFNKKAKSLAVAEAYTNQSKESKQRTFTQYMATAAPTPAAMATASQTPPFDHLKAIKAFEDTKMGVKGLVDSGITSIPPFFIFPPQTLSDLKPNPSARPDVNGIPTVDLSEKRPSVVSQIARACRELGFIQIVNHGIPLEVMDQTIEAVKGFHEQPPEMKAPLYGRSPGTGVNFFSNVDLFQSKAASWRDTLQVRLGPDPAPAVSHLPEICRNEIVEWNLAVKKLGEHLMELLCEGLGLDKGRLKEMMFLESRVMVGHYYPHCPQPDLTLGITSHTDPGVLTILMQSQIGGLQIKHGDDWVDVKPVPGALVINIGDILQILSNDEYKSVEHRVLANPCREPRTSVGVFFNSINRDGLFGPFPELTSPEKPAVYRQFVYMDYLQRFFTKELDGRSLKDFYRLKDTELV
ncbi:1-aminocyclopropane-1-carboxylate oxidase homolog 4-like [Tripterygium wilfordii]|uniref:1-aminocyclopropane-1-carboxylate oxidase homolog 4-like n=1 Tax=Tripterygium wilfordii TaxID=458696 RepID=UPI0018F847F8|nr:1-aminocyclopropane-1-carboxylate oxidase homolog 4-like [Tripterygium wilfordii]